MAYHVTKDLKAEVKVSGSLFLKDLLILVLYVEDSIYYI